MAQVEELFPDLVPMDMNIEGIGGIEATGRITGNHAEVSVVLLSTYDAEDLPEDARHRGASADVHNEQFGPELLETIRRAGGPRLERPRRLGVVVGQR